MERLFALKPLSRISNVSEWYLHLIIRLFNSRDMYSVQKLQTYLLFNLFWKTKFSFVASSFSSGQLGFCLKHSTTLQLLCSSIFLNFHHSFTSRYHLSLLRKGFQQHVTQWTSCETGYLVSEETCGNGFSPTFPVDLNMLVPVNQR